VVTPAELGDKAAQFGIAAAVTLSVKVTVPVIPTLPEGAVSVAVNVTEALTDVLVDVWVRSRVVEA
jgi:hypothetical protein